MDVAPLEALCLEAIRDTVFPGVAFAVIHPEGVGGSAVGRHRYQSDSTLVSASTLFDMASLTKVVVTTTLAMLVFESGELDLNKPVVEYLPAFGGGDKSSITVEDLMRHRSGLPAFRPYHLTTSNPEEARSAILAEPLVGTPRSTVLYSDLSMIIVGWIIESVLGDRLDALAQSLVFRPLEMMRSYFEVPDQLRPECAPTESAEPWRAGAKGYTQGVVHDPTCWRLGGISGHAGLFSCLSDLVCFAKECLERRLLPVSSTTWDLFTSSHAMESTRALGWDTNAAGGISAGSRLSPAAFGHTGFTGTSIWIDRASQVAVVLLTNRVHPSATNSEILRFRPKFHDLAAQSFLG